MIPSQQEAICIITYIRYTFKSCPYATGEYFLFPILGKLICIIVYDFSPQNTEWSCRKGQLRFMLFMCTAGFIWYILYTGVGKSVYKTHILGWYNYLPVYLSKEISSENPAECAINNDKIWLQLDGEG